MAKRRRPNLIERFGMRLADGYLREATGSTYDPDTDGFRRLTDSKRDLTPMELERARDISLHLWRTNPMAKRIIEMMVDFTIGADGIVIEAVNDRHQKVLDEFWEDPVTNLKDRHRDLVRDKAIYGELAFLKATAAAGGRMRLGVLAVERIVDVIPDPDNVLVDRTIMVSQSDGLMPKPVDLVRWVDGEAATEAGLDVSGQWAGDAMYFAVNRLTGQHRGTPDLLALADWVDGYDQLLFNALERSGLINAFVWDVTLQGSDDDAVQDWITKHGSAPPPGSVRVHNEKEVWASVSPDLNTQDLMAIGRPIKNQALGGAGLPEAWYAEGDSANRATLAAQGDPTYRMLQSRQRAEEAMFTRILQVATQEAVNAGRLTEADIADGFRITLPDLSAKDTATISAALPQLANAVVTAIAEELIDKKSARSLFLMLASQLGVDLNVDDVEAAIEAERAEREAEEAKRAEELARAAAAMAGQAGEEPEEPEPAASGDRMPPEPPPPPRGGRGARARTRGR